jgi:4-alpha-glucanotransferase
VRGDRSYEDLVDRAARCYGIEPDYYDIWGRLHIVPLDTKVALLRAMGVCADTREGLEAALSDKERGEWVRPLPPAVVADAARLAAEGIVVHLPSMRPSASCGLPEDIAALSFTVRDELGGERELRVAREAFSWQGEKNIGGVWYERYRMRWEGPLECGYYHVTLIVDGPLGSTTSCMLLAICPGKAYLPEGVRSGRRFLGIHAPLFALRSSKDWGIGDLRDLRTFAQWAAAALGADFVGINPLHATFNRPPLSISPYYPSSRIYRNYAYLAVDEIPEFAESAGAKEALSRLSADPSWKEMLERPRVDFERVAAAKKEILERVFETFLERHWAERTRGDARAEGFQRYRQEKGESLEWCATFFALEEHVSGEAGSAAGWGQWPHEFRDRTSSAVRAFQAARSERILFYEFLQWQLEEQLSRSMEAARECGLSMGLYLDMALSVDPWGADRWVFKDVFAEGATVGAPPDDFSPKGQDWGIAPLVPHRLRETGYEVFIQTLRENCAHAAMLRLDHVMGLFRLFWIPHGGSPADGAYVRMPSEDLLGIVLLESRRHEVVVVGEDLGTVPPYVRERLREADILSCRLFLFEREADGRWRSPSEYPAQAVAAVTTHDLPTLRGFWEGRDISIREALGLFPGPEGAEAARRQRVEQKQAILTALCREGLLPAGRTASESEDLLSREIQMAVIAYLARTPCWCVALNHEDIFMGADQLNLPGTSTEYPNWTARMEYSLEELSDDPRVREVVSSIRQVVRAIHSGTT